MVEPAIIGASFTAGLLSAASPCVLAAVPVTVGFVGGGATDRRTALRLTLGFVIGMIGAFVALGLAAARLGMFFGTLGPGWTAAGGMVIVTAGAFLLTRRDVGALCPAALRGWMQAHLGGTGLTGAVLLGALTGTVMTPCATPVLGAALALAGSGGVLGGSALTGALMLLAYAIGRSPLLLFAGLAPQGLSALTARIRMFDRFLPGQRIFSVLMIGTGLWLVANSGIFDTV